MNFTILNFHLRKMKQNTYMFNGKHGGGMYLTKSMPSDITLYVGKESRPGNSSISPVLVLKQAPCQGHLTLFPIKTPVHVVDLK